MMKRFNKLCSLLLTFAVTATTVFSADMSMVTAFADDDVQAVAVEEEQTEDAVAVAAVEADVDAAIADAVVEEAVVADETAVAVEEAEVVADEEIAADDEVTGEVTEADEVEDAEGGKWEFDSVRNSTKFSAFKVASVSANVDADGDIENYFVAIEYTLKADQAKPEAYDFEIDEEPMTADKVVGEITEKGVTFKVSAGHSGVGYVYCRYAGGEYVMAEVIFDVDDINMDEDIPDITYDLDSNTVSSNKGLIVTFAEEDYDIYADKYYDDDDDRFYNGGAWSADSKKTNVWYAGIIAASKGNYYYTGKAVKPNLTIFDGNVRLKEGVDYTVKYKNNTKPYNKLDLSAAAVGTSYDVEDAAAPYVEIIGKGTYAKELDQKKYFNIIPAEIKPCNLYNGNYSFLREWIADEDYEAGGYWYYYGYDYYNYMTHADGLIKNDYIVTDKEAKVKTDVVINSGIVKTKDKKGNIKYKGTTTKLKTGKGDAGDYFIKYISFNGLYDYCDRDYSLEGLAKASDKAWNDPKATDKVTESNLYVALVSGNAAEGKLEAKAMAVDSFTVVDKDHDVRKAKITVSSESIVSYNKIADGMREGFGSFEVNPASITSMKIGKNELTPEQIAKFGFKIYGPDQKVGKNRKIYVYCLSAAFNDGYRGNAVCKSKFEITADKDINALKAYLNVTENGKSVFKEFDDKGNIEVTFGEFNIGYLNNYQYMVSLSDNATGVNYVRTNTNVVADKTVYGWNNTAKSNTKYVGKYTINIEGIGKDGYAGKRKLTINVKPAEAKAAMVSMNNTEKFPAYVDGVYKYNAKKYWEMTSDGSAMVYQEEQGDDDNAKVTYTGVNYRQTGYYDDYFNGYRYVRKLADAFDKSLYKINLAKGQPISAAYNVSIKMNNAKKANAGDTVEGKFVYKGAVKGEIPFSFTLVADDIEMIVAEDVALKVSDNFLYSDKACATKITAYRAPLAGYKVVNGALKEQYKAFTLKEGKDYKVLDGRYKSYYYENGVKHRGYTKLNDTSKLEEPIAAAAYKENDSVVGEEVNVLVEGMGNYKPIVAYENEDYYDEARYRVGIDIKVFKKEIEDMIKDALIYANKYQGSEETTKAQIGQKKDSDYLYVMSSYLSNSEFKLDNSKVGTIELKYGDAFDINWAYDKPYNAKSELLSDLGIIDNYRNGVAGIAGKQLVEVVGNGLLVGTLDVKIDVDTRKKAEVSDYKYVLSK